MYDIEMERSFGDLSVNHIAISAAKKSASRKWKVGIGKADLKKYEKVAVTASHPFFFFILNINFIHPSIFGPSHWLTFQCFRLQYNEIYRTIDV